MKKIVVFMLCVCFLVPAISFSEEWICPSCGNTASGNFCNNCGLSASEVSSLSENTSVDTVEESPENVIDKEVHIDGYSIVVPSDSMYFSNEDGIYIYPYYSSGDETSAIRVYIVDVYADEEEYIEFYNNLGDILIQNINEMGFFTVNGTSFPTYKKNASYAGHDNCREMDIEVYMQILLTKKTAYCKFVIVEHAGRTYMFDIESQEKEKTDTMARMLNTIVWDE